MTPRIDAVLADEWLRMAPWERRALCLLGHCYTLERRLAKDEFMPWPEIETPDRVALIRAMRAVGDFAEQCAAGLELARASLEEHWREELLR